MNRNICVYLDFLTSTHVETMTTCAKENGYTIAFFNPDQLEQAITYAQTCQVIIANKPALLQAAPATLEWYACPNAGVENFCNNPDWFKNPNTILTNCAGAYGVTIGEHMVMVTIMMMRNELVYTTAATERRWGLTQPMRSIRGSRVTVVGTGDIGCSYAAHVKAMGASHVTGLSRSGKARSDVFDTMLTIDKLESVLPQSDVIAFSLPNTPETAGLMTRERLAMLPTSAYLVNVGRGNVLDQEALMDALNHDQLAGAAIDVMIPEPLPSDHPLWDTKNLLITPHVAGDMALGYTADKSVSIFCENMARFAKGEPLNHVVDRTKGY